MKSYKHKITGRVALLVAGEYVSINRDGGNNFRFPIWAVENTYDWEESIEDKELISEHNGHKYYSGDTFFRAFLDDGKVWRLSAFHGSKPGVGNDFKTKEEAEQYIRDNKPVYPAGLVEPIMDMINTDGWVYRIRKELDKLKAFKPTS